MADKKISQLTGASTPLAGTEVLPIVQSGSTVKVSAADVTAGRAVSALTYTSTVATGTAPLTVTSTTEVANLRAANATSADSANAVKSNATTGLLQVAGPAAASTRVMTTPDANFTVARTDAANSFTGNQTLATGNLIQGTAAKGIDFSANTGAAGETSSLLNWYEEGTFTPVISGTSSAGTGTYSVQNGAYVRIGKMVQYQIYIVLTAHTGTGDIAIGGLPFAAGTGHYPPAAVYVNNLALTAGYYPQIAVSTASTNFLVRQVPTGGGAAIAIPMDTAFDILLSGTYQV